MQPLIRLLLAFLLLPNLLLAQNLVPNPSFEDTVSCPTTTGQISAAKHWTAARYSPDYFNSCSNVYNPIVGVPNNTFGNQMPLTGMAYGGFISYINYLGEYREYMQVPLIQPLTIGEEYNVMAYFSRGSSASFDCATNKIGFKFTSKLYNADLFDSPPIDNQAHVYTNDIINDTTNWVSISGSYVADSSYSYLLIGNFFSDSSTNTTSCLGIAYYYIDNVCVSASSTGCQVLSNPQYIFPESRISLFPNPASTQLTVDKLNIETDYFILNSYGNVITSGKVTKIANVISVRGLPNGLYVLQLINSCSLKFIISR